MSTLREQYEDAVKEASLMACTVEFEWVNDNDGSYSLAVYEYNCVVERANKLYLELKQEEGEE